MLQSKHERRMRALKEYACIVSQTLEVYDHIERPAWEACLRITEPARAEYERKLQQIEAEGKED